MRGSRRSRLASFPFQVGEIYASLQAETDTGKVPGGRSDGRFWGKEMTDGARPPRRQAVNGVQGPV